MARKNRSPEENARREKIRELLQIANIGSMDDIQNLFKETIAEFMENGLEAELDEDLGYSRYDYKNKATDNSRNGHSSKTLRTSFGDVEVSVPRDRKGEFEPQVLKKGQTSISQDVEEKILSMYAKGMTTSDIEAHIQDIYGISVSDSTISRITDKILPIAKEWQQRPLESIYAVVFLDAIHYHVRSEGQIVKKAVYIAIGINLDGRKDVLGMWVGENESAKFWATVLNGLKNRGVEDIFIACTDNLTGFDAAIHAVFPKTEIQNCIIHQLRNSSKYVSYKDLKALMADLKAVYAAMSGPRTYFAIDLKSYYASAECAARGLDPLTTNLVVADASRTEKTICLAVSPSLKALGIPGRARLFEVVQKVREANAARLRAAIRSRAAVKKDGKWSLAAPSYDAKALAADPSLEISYLVAPPRMAYYEKVSRQIYGIYLKYVAPEDMVVYSIDEVFIDATPYLPYYNMSPHDLAKTMIREVLYTTGITATAGIGSNLYLAKLAMDITAKHAAPDQDGVRIAELNEESFRYLLWDHKPLTDFWQVGPGTVRRLEKHGIHTMGELARASLYSEDMLYREFGVDAEILIDHAWGLEPCGMKEINTYQPETNSICEGQVLSCPYDCEKTRLIVQEMTDSLVYQLMDKGLVTDGLTLDIGYDRENCDKGGYRGPVHIDRYGRTLPKPAHGSVRLESATNLGSQLQAAAAALFDRIADPKLTVRRLTLTANRVVRDEGIFQTDFFTDAASLEKEKSLQEAMLGLKKRFGKNAVLKGSNYLEGATMRDRNGRIGGHKAE